MTWESIRVALNSPSAKWLAAGGVAAVGACVAVLVSTSPGRAKAESGSFVRDGRAGFVLTEFRYALGPDTQGTNHCPAGMAKNVAEIYAETSAGRRRPGEGDEEYSNRLQSGGEAISADDRGQNYCLHPEIAPRDPSGRVMLSPTARADGIDLDGMISRSDADLRSGRLDFVSPEGRKGVDNQFWRAIGCNKSFQKAGLSNEFQTTMYTGSWGVLILLDGVDDIRNDGHVGVTIAANADPMRLSPTRAALEYATYAMDGDDRFRAQTSGHIKDGVLITEPVDIRLHQDVNGMYLERPLKLARIEAKLSAQGVLGGYLAGYTPVEDFYNFQFGYRNARGAKGEPAPLARRLGSSNGAARVLGHTCQGVYQSLYRMADGDRDPKSGRFTSISTQYRFEARPAFIVDAPANDAMEGTGKT